MNVYIGFDSAWTGNTPGAAALISEDAAGLQFTPPWAQDFVTAAICFAQHSQGANLSVIAIDQPTIVKNPVGFRPVEKSITPIIGRLGSAVQPANTGNLPMFGPAAPIWGFLNSLNYTQNPTLMRPQNGHYLIEVYPCLNIVGLFPGFYTRQNRQYPQNCGEVARYNPTRETFQAADWGCLCNCISDYGTVNNINGLSRWAGNHAGVKPTHHAQDKLDAVLCAIMAFEWTKKGDAPSHVIVIGDTEEGYMVTVAHDAMADEIAKNARGNVAFTRF